MKTMIKFLEVKKMYHGKKKKMGHGGMNMMMMMDKKKMGMMGGGMMRYNQGGYASIAEMEKACAIKASTTLKK